MKTRKKESQSEQVERLGKTDAGCALRDLIYHYASQSSLASVLGLRPAQITQWVSKCRVSMAGAELIEEKLGIKKEIMRPDVSDWSKPEPGRKLGHEADRTGPHQQAIRELCAMYGGAGGMASAFDTTASAVNKWAHRNYIPYRHRLRIIEKGVPKHIEEALA